MSSENRFGYEWNRYSKIDPQYEGQFRNWTYPFGPDDFKNKRVLDAGCGMGRNSYWPAVYGAQGVIAFDFDKRSVSAARKNLSAFANVQVEFWSIYEIPWQDEFDIAFSIGVIHHLEQPEQALARLVRVLKPSGRLLIWVYSYEGNEWIPRFVDPVRKHITSRLPVALVHALAYLVSGPLWLVVKFFKGSSPYFKQLSRFKFWHLHSIVFDQLIPKVAHYWKYDEVRALIKGLPLENIFVHAPPNHNGWILIATKK